MTGRFEDLIATNTAEVAAARRQPEAYPRGWEPGIAYGAGGVAMVTSVAQTSPADPHAYHDLVRELGGRVEPGYRVVLIEQKYDPVAWTRDTPDQDKAVTRAVWRYRFRVEPDPGSIPVDELIKRVKRFKPSRVEKVDGHAYSCAMGDTQFGKVDGDGVEGTTDRVLASIEASVQRFKDLRRKQSLGSIYLPWLGDCLEGFNSQGGANAWRTTLTLTEQFRLVSRLMQHQVEEHAKLSDEIYLLSIPGNHDETVRFGKGGVTTYSDSWAVQAAVSVGDALATNPAAFGHVKVVVPQRDELTLTLDLAGTIVGFAHGHQMRPGQAMRWWAEQAHGRQPIGDSTLLFTAHLHHLKIDQAGPKTHVQVMAQEGESTWWRHRHGQVAPKGAVSMVVGGGGWRDLAIL